MPTGDPPTTPDAAKIHSDGNAWTATAWRTPLPTLQRRFVDAAGDRPLPEPAVYDGSRLSYVYTARCEHCGGTLQIMVHPVESATPTVDVLHRDLPK